MKTRLKNETKEQAQFREDMEEAGYKVRLYSGYGRHGQQTYGVDCPSQWSDRDGPREHDVIRATKVSTSADPMGRGTIVFCASYCKEHPDDFEEKGP